ncbi:NAD(P)/FAD-dependent oxidoreductase [Niabella yanshanensis]|uniref:NAD(P)/FAD-dependent oxidoreductase n=1 Tax=Niabella yanshanensis TaxID=577386 RepID=A0ABZ0WAY7_9BACT|nr:NAD(P)/FAD-dependent oxidoreductase [Niabella yanshanensis]WQD40321.1 NAD(P)/FAD-dependent oxidoreductase [Niabella yanshanensis]
MNDELYDVIIVGGRIAGASLAARLGAAGLKVLILEKDMMPGRTVVSCPLLLSSGMQLLDEIGIDESLYAPDNTRFAGVALEMSEYFRTFVEIPDVHGRHFLYGIDRQILDEAIWRNLERFPSVTQLENFSVRELLVDEDGKVSGVTGMYKGGESKTFSAGAVIGADGRHSVVARKANASITEEVKQYNTAVYYAYWEGVAPYKAQDKEWIQIHSGCNGFSAVVIPASRGLTGVLAQCRHDYFNAPAGADEWYHSTIASFPRVAQRLKNAHQVTPLSGMKNVSNLFRQAAGNGWTLVGDAYHQKDSYDAQGIYDALLGAKILALQLIDWKEGKKDWGAAMQAYNREVYDALHPMFRSTLDRLKREMFTCPSPKLANGLLRWVLTNKKYRERFGLLATRNISPKNWASPGVMISAILNGAVADLRRKPNQAVWWTLPELKP